MPMRSSCLASQSPISCRCLHPVPSAKFLHCWRDCRNDFILKVRCFAKGVSGNVVVLGARMMDGIRLSGAWTWIRRPKRISECRGHQIRASRVEGLVFCSSAVFRAGQLVMGKPVFAAPEFFSKPEFRRAAGDRQVHQYGVPGCPTDRFNGNNRISHLRSLLLRKGRNSCASCHGSFVVLLTTTLNVLRSLINSNR